MLLGLISSLFSSIYSFIIFISLLFIILSSSQSINNFMVCSLELFNLIS